MAEEVFGGAGAVKDVRRNASGTVDAVTAGSGSTNTTTTGTTKTVTVTTTSTHVQYDKLNLSVNGGSGTLTISRDGSKVTSKYFSQGTSFTTSKAPRTSVSSWKGKVKWTSGLGGGNTKKQTNTTRGFTTGSTNTAQGDVNTTYNGTDSNIYAYAKFGSGNSTLDYGTVYAYTGGDNTVGTGQTFTGTPTNTVTETVTGQTFTAFGVRVKGHNKNGNSYNLSIRAKVGTDSPSTGTNQFTASRHTITTLT